jgi:glycosyltransferase involved in cell wall biosynthesis
MHGLSALFKLQPSIVRLHMIKISADREAQKGSDILCDLELHIVGIVGVPGSYGGFETLADYLLDSEKIRKAGATVYCERTILEAQGRHYKGAKLVALRWKANGWQSVVYDLNALWIASRAGGAVLILGTSATFILPVLMYLFPRVKYIVNMAGLEWSRSKWGRFASWFLKFNELIAAKYAHVFVTDNQGLKDYVYRSYGRNSDLIPYGGDQFLKVKANQDVFKEFDLPDTYDFAMSRAQKDNNMEIILDAYASNGNNLIFVSNWNSSSYGRQILSQYGHFPNISLIGPIYDIEKVKALHTKTRFYIHGHSAGGTNPVLVESMWARLPILAFDVPFNRHTTCDKAFYFSTPTELNRALMEIDGEARHNCADKLFEVAGDMYKWSQIITAYEVFIFREQNE